MESHIESVQQAVVKPFRVSVEGNIGAGKSTLITHFSGFPDVDAYMVSCFTNFQKCALNYHPREPPVESHGTPLGWTLQPNL
jgi:ABC-type thiamine transport system ATPase subunit